ncbi:hypothetical protein DVK05_03340 [Halorubrum sp. Atlit-8R]|uniref:hypothetical protein n=1 Tax=unclassified Halorubrum TaxID=2642239 RepID=UPI000EF246C5|nr:MULTISPECIES: hypothetical protein [unclassified Halorubrum]RLM71011.1 hypothetical protein DVK08_02420 [Halorubrum sp. Atlit-9R]RLM71879.1 hypothetical protein DVK08_07165 [Halorubrum sp. Atlit-9R]RLM82836.1 hypothetical protein DVK05_03340 [Halorubrum sp. Atlit-8R]
MRHGPLNPPIGDHQGPSGPRTLSGLAAFTLLAAVVVGTLLVPAVGPVAIAAATVARLVRATNRRHEAGRQSPADASPSEPRPHAD